MVELQRAGRQPAHPPFAALLLDVRLANPGQAPRWFLLPDIYDPATRPLGGGVNAAECYALGGGGRAVLCRLLGVGGAQALLLPPGGTLLLRGLVVKHLAAAEPASLALATAAELLIGDEPAAAWLGLDPTCDAHAEVDARERRLLAARNSEGLVSLPLRLVDESRMTAALGQATEQSDQ